MTYDEAVAALQDTKTPDDIAAQARAVIAAADAAARSQERTAAAEAVTTALDNLRTAKRGVADAFTAYDAAHDAADQAVTRLNSFHA